VGTAKLAEALAESGCPVCRVSQEWEDRGFWGLLWEHVNDPVIRRDFRQRRGHCPYHLARFLLVEEERHLGAGGVAIFLRELCLSIADDLDRDPPTLPVARCRPCEYRYRRDLDLARLIGIELAHEGFRAVYGASDGVCLPHAWMALGAPTRRDAVEALARYVVDRAHDLHEGGRPMPTINWLHGHSGPPQPADNTPPDASAQLDVDDEILRLAVETPGCTLCNLEAEDGRRLLDRLLDSAPANWTEGDDMADLCREHLLEMFRLEQWRPSHDTRSGQVLRAAVPLALDTWKQRADERQAAVPSFTVPRWLIALGFPPRPATFPLPRTTCHVCTQRARFSAGIATRYSALLVEPEFLQAATRLDGLCATHLRTILAQTDPTVASKLAASHGARLRTIAASVGEFLRLCRWETRHEPRGEEQRAPGLAMRFFVHA
jgi:hypothetical protein